MHIWQPCCLRASRLQTPESCRARASIQLLTQQAEGAWRLWELLCSKSKGVQPGLCLSNRRGQIWVKESLEMRDWSLCGPVIPPAVCRFKCLGLRGKYRHPLWPSYSPLWQHHSSSGGSPGYLLMQLRGMGNNYGIHCYGGVR